MLRLIIKKICFLSIVASVLCSNQDYDPLKVHTYTLSNGLTVYLNEDHNTTSVFGAIAVRGGGKRDPEDATGIAHYLEHLLFKGTQELGTIDYSKEKVFLDSIEFKYDQLGQTQDEDKRLAIQKEINELSIKAGEYAIPNEFDRLMEGMGGSWINAFTSNDAIVYLNKIPGNQIEGWLDVYSHRFVNPVFRLFQSELETVYEEKNRSMDNVFSQVFEIYSENFFKNHPYGQQTILGSVDHLKNPSLSKMTEYFEKYYVANNMALILTGDIYIDEVMPMIEEKFSSWKSGEVPAPLNIDEDPFDGREKLTKRLTPIKLGVMGFRTVPSGHPDEETLNLCTQLLTNESKTGLIDQLVVNGKIMEAGAFNMNFVDHGGANFFFMPKLLFQSLRRAEKLVMGQVDKLKSGDFDDEFFNAVKLTMTRQHEQNIENMEGRLFSLISTYIEDKTWEDVSTWPNRLDKITKEDVVKVANKYFGDDYFVFNSKMGFPKKNKLEKPPFKPVIPKNSEKQSDYAASVRAIPAKQLDLKFIEFDSDVTYKEISNNIHLYKSENPINSIFNLTLQYSMGTLEDSKLEQAAELLNLLGTSNYSFNEFKSALQKIGTTISFSSDKNYFMINVKGFDKYFDESIQYVNEFISNVKGDDKKIKILADNAKSSRKMEAEDTPKIGRALRDYVNFGDKSYYLRRLTLDEIKKSKSTDYIASFKNALNYELSILYSGRLDMDNIESSIKGNLTLSENPINSDFPASASLVVNKRDKNTIFLVDDKEAVQSQIFFLSSGNIINEENRAASAAYNKYFSGGMSSIVFQEIREFRSLAYSSWASYNTPWHNDKEGNFMGYVGCQADKTLEAISVFKDIALNMPLKPERLEQTKSSLIKGINSKRPNFRRFPSMVSSWMMKGYTEDPRKTQVDYFNTMSFDDIVNFQKEHVSNQPMTITILTDKERIDMEELKKFGEIIILDKDDILN